jgi:hypothetical protein
VTVVYAVIAVAGLIVVGCVLARHIARQRPRYIYSAAWTDEHWRERHERAKARHPDDRA